MRKGEAGQSRGKIAKSGEFERLNRQPAPMPIFMRRASVQVYMGAGWQAGLVSASTTLYCVIWLEGAQRMICCTDKRNIRYPSK